MGLTPGGRLASLNLAAVPISNLSAGAPTWRRVYAMHSMLVRSLFFPGYLGACSFMITNHIFHTFNLLNVSLVSMTSGYSFQITDSYSTYMECKQRTQHWSNGIPSISFLFSSHDIDAAFRSPIHQNI